MSTIRFTSDFSAGTMEARTTKTTFLKYLTFKDILKYFISIYILILTKTRISLQKIMLHGKIQTQKKKYCMFPFIKNTKIRKAHLEW